MGSLLLPPPLDATPVPPPPPPPLPPKRAKAAAKQEPRTPSVPPLPPRGLKYLSEVVDVKRKPLFYQSISCAALKTLFQHIVQNPSKNLQSVLVNSIGPEQLSSLTWLFININELKSSPEKQSISSSEFIVMITELIDELVLNYAISLEYHGVLLRDLGLHHGCWPLFVSHNVLCILARVLIIRSEREDDTLLVNIWKRLAYVCVIYYIVY